MANTDIGIHLLSDDERAILEAPYPGFAAPEIAARRERADQLVVIVPVSLR